MATIKVACPKCGQKVSGDETFYGTTVECPICSSDIHFPGQRRQETRSDWPAPRASDGWTGPLPPVPPEGGVPPAPRHAEADHGDADPPDPPSRTTGDGGDAAPPMERSVTLPPDGEDGPLLPPSPLWGSLSIVSGVLSLVLCVLGGVVFAPLAIIFGHTALAKARHSPVQPAPGHTLGAIGLLIGYVSLVLTILVLLAAVIFDDAIREILNRAEG